MGTSKNNYKSRLEADFAKFLTSKKIKFRYEPFKLKYYIDAPRARCQKCGHNKIWIERNYLPDFVSNNGLLVIETKGRFTSSDRTKMLAVVQANPQIDVRMFFAKDNWLTRRHKTKYSDWCKQHKITFAIGEIPKQWLEDLKHAV
jgi:hypothetical protein